MNSQFDQTIRPNSRAATASLCGSAREQRLSQAIDEYYAAVDAGHSPDRQSLCEKYADIADELQECLHNLDFIRQVSPQLSSPDGASNAFPTHEPAAGILGDFRILGELGRGGMGVVYEAEQLSLGRRVALKVLPFAAMLDKQQLARFKNEARAAATLDHPNIVSIHSVGAERGVHYYAMQLIEGQSLAEVIAAMKQGVWGQGAGSREEPTVEHRSSTAAPQSAIRNPKSAIETSPAAHLSTIDEPHTLLAGHPLGGSSLPAFSSRDYYRTVARLGIQAAEALDHAHQHGILHRDIKPANLLLDESHKLWITDFGLARIEQDAGLTMTGDLMGTLRYMSPEQALAKRVVVDHRSDIYSLGVTLYELLTLQPAYTADDRQELLRQIAFEEPKPLRKLDRHIPKELETIILKAIEKNPADRYETAQRLADDLRAYLDDHPIKAKPPTLVSRTKKWSRRHKPLVASAIAAVVAIVLISFAVLASSNVAIKREQDITRSALAERTAALAEKDKALAERTAALADKDNALAEKASALLDRTAALDRAEWNYKKALEAVDQLLARVGNEKLADVPQLDKLRMDVLQDTTGFYESFLTENPQDRQVQFELATVYRRLATMHDDFLRTAAALFYQQKAIALLDELHEHDPSNARYRYELAVVQYQQVWITGMDSVCDQSIELLEGLVAEFPDNVSYREALAEALRSSPKEQLENPDVIDSSYAHAKPPWLIERTFEVARSPGVFKRLLGNAYHAAGVAAFTEGRLDESETNFRHAIRVFEEASKERPTDGRTREYHGQSYHFLNEVYRLKGNKLQVEECFRRGIQILDELTDDFPSMRDFAQRRNNLTTMFIRELLVPQGRLQDGVEFVNRREPSHPLDFIARAETYNLLLEPALAQADFQLAVDRSQQALQADPSHVLAYESWFLGLLGLGRAEEAKSLVRNMPTPDVQSVSTRASLYSRFPGREPSDDQVLIDLRSLLVERIPTVTTIWKDRALAYAGAGQFELAAKDFSEIIRLDPGKADEIYVERALVYRKMKRFDDALRDCSIAIEMRPDKANYWNARAIILHDMKQYDLANKDYSEAIRRKPHSAAFRKNRAIVRQETKQYDLAVEDLTEVIRLDPNNAMVWNDRGVARAAMNQDELAVEDFSEAIRIDPERARYWNQRGRLHFKMKRYDESIADLTEAIRLEPGKAVVFSNRADSYISLNRFEEALGDIDEAIRMEPVQARYWNLRGVVYFRLKEFDKSIADVTVAIQLDSENPAYWRNRGEARAANNQHSLAVDDYSEAIRLDPESAAHWNHRGLAREALRQFELAIEDYTQAIRIDPRNSQFWNSRGLARHARKQYELALEDLTAAIRISPEIPELLNNRGVVYFNLGRYREAINDYQAALEINSKYRHAQVNLAWIRATASDDEYRDGNRAVELAQSAYDLGNFGDDGEARFLRVMAAAYAEAGDFQRAVAHCQKAIELDAESDKDNDWAKELPAQLESYQAGRPWRLPPSAEIPSAEAANRQSDNNSSNVNAAASDGHEADNSKLED